MFFQESKKKKKGKPQGAKPIRKQLQMGDDAIKDHAQTVEHDVPTHFQQQFRWSADERQYYRRQWPPGITKRTASIYTEPSMLALFQALYINFLYLLFTTILRGKCSYFFYFKEKETEEQHNGVIHPKSLRGKSVFPTQSLCHKNHTVSLFDF